MKKIWSGFAASLIGGACIAGLTTAAMGDLIGGTYTSLPISSTTWPGSPVYTSLANGSALSSATTGQGYPGQDSNADGTLLSEVVTPSTSITLASIVIPTNAIGTFNTGGMSLHIFPLSFTSPTGSTFFSSSSSVYNPGTDLLGGGSGLNFSSAGTGSAHFLAFSLDNGTTNDNVTLTGGTSYAIEFWNSSQNAAVSGESAYTANQMIWLRNGGSPTDPGGQAFAGSDTLLSSTASSTTTGLRGTIAQYGLAGGSPRDFAIALYSTANPVPVPEPMTLSLVGCATAGLMLRRRKMV